MKLIDIEDEALLKTVSSGKMSMKQLWKRICSEREVDAIPVSWLKEREEKADSPLGKAIYRVVLEKWRKGNEEQIEI